MPSDINVYRCCKHVLLIRWNYGLDVTNFAFGRWNAFIGRGRFFVSRRCELQICSDVSIDLRPEHLCPSRGNVGRGSD